MKKKILVVDDSRTFHVHIKNLLEDKFEIINTLDPRETLPLALKHNPDLFLIDLEMPHLNGKQVAQIILNDPRFNNAPIIIMTGSFSDILYMEAIESGASDILSKDASASTIANKINAVIRQKELIKKEIQLKQLDAVTALIATSNHEFNNALFISNQLIKKALKNAPADNQKLLESLRKIQQMNDRILSVVQKLSSISEINLLNTNPNLDTIDEENIPMLKI